MDGKPTLLPSSRQVHRNRYFRVARDPPGMGKRKATRQGRIEAHRAAGATSKPVCPTLPTVDRVLARKIALRQFPVGRSM